MSPTASARARRSNLCDETYRVSHRVCRGTGFARNHPGGGRPADQGDRHARPAVASPSKEALELSSREAETLGHAKADTGHLLLGLIDVGNSQATQILNGLGTDPRRVRQKVIELLDPSPGTGEQ